MRRESSRVACFLVVGLVGCVQSLDEQDEGAVLEDVQWGPDLYEPPRALDRSDLVWGAGKLWGRGIDAAVRRVPYANVQRRPTVLYGLTEDGRRVRNVRNLHDTLAARFGERSLPADVAQARVATRERGEAAVFAEAAFAASPVVPIPTQVPGLGLSVGLSPGSIPEVRVVTAQPDAGDALFSRPLEVIAAARNFVLPATLQDIAAMKPGEATSIRGPGRIAFNLSFSAPVVTLVHGPLTWGLTFGGGGYKTILQTRTASGEPGTIDWELIRLDDDVVLLEVGVTDAEVEGYWLSLEDGFGIQGLVRRKVELGGVEIDLGRIVERTLERELERRFAFSARVSHDAGNVERQTLSRFRISLSQSGTEVQQALAQALGGDLRYLQELARTGTEGVTTDVDVVRSGETSYSYAGLSVLGLSFFDEVRSTSARATVQTPGGALSLLGTTFEHREGAWLERHGYGRTALAGIVLSPGASPGVQTSLGFSWTASDTYMERDELLDHTGTLMAALLGPEREARVTQPLDALGRWTDRACLGQGARADQSTCAVEILSLPRQAELVADARNAFDQESAAARLPEDEARIVRAAFELSLAANRAIESGGPWFGGPHGEIAASVWLSDEALADWLGNLDAPRAAALLREILAAVTADREEADGRLAASGGLMAGWTEGTTEVLATRAAAWRELMGLAQHSLERTASVVGEDAHLVTLGVDAARAGQYETLVAASLAERRRDLVIGLVESLLLRVRSTGEEQPERAVGPALLSWTSPRARDIRFDVDLSIDERWLRDLYPQYAAAGYQEIHDGWRGPAARRPGESFWDVERLVRVTP